MPSSTKTPIFDKKKFCGKVSYSNSMFEEDSMSSNISRRSVWIVGMVALLVLGLILTACGGATTPAAEAPAPTEEAVGAAPPAEDTPAAVEEPEPTDTPEESSPAETSTETEALSIAQGATAAACLPADPNTDPLAGAILYLDKYIDDNDINEGIPAVTDADWTKGPANAPVTIIEFGDFQ